MGWVIAALCGYPGPPRAGRPSSADFGSVAWGYPFGVLPPLRRTLGSLESTPPLLARRRISYAIFAWGLSGHDPFVPASTPLLLYFLAPESTFLVGRLHRIRHKFAPRATAIACFCLILLPQNPHFGGPFP